MSEYSMLVILGILELQLKTVLVAGAFFVMYKFYNLFKASFSAISEELEQLK